jgi:UDP-N-acetyl-D-galactosamine dehydrogenase
METMTKRSTDSGDITDRSIADSLQESVAVIGLGYVGLPVALAIAKQLPNTLGFDIDSIKVDELLNGSDRTGETSPEVLQSTSLRFCSQTEELRGATFFVVAVPTPIDNNRQPDLKPLIAACQTIGRAMQAGSVVVFESTVYPGVTEEICGPILAEQSGLEQGKDLSSATPRSGSTLATRNTPSRRS